MSLFTVVSFVRALIGVAQANHDEDVKYALQILEDLPADLAEPFCHTFGGEGGGGATSTYTVTSAPFTITTTLEPTPCSETEEYTQVPYETTTPDVPDYSPYPESSSDTGYSPAPSEDVYPHYTTTLNGFDYPEHRPAPGEHDYPPYSPEPTTDADPVYIDEPSNGGIPIFTPEPSIIIDPIYTLTPDIPIYIPPPSGLADPAMTSAPSTMVDTTFAQITSLPVETMNAPDDEDTTIDITSTTTLTFFQTSTIFVDPLGSATDLPTDTVEPATDFPTDIAEPVTEFPTEFPVYATESATDLPVYAATDLPVYAAEPSFVPVLIPKKRSPKFLLNRATWCPEDGRPCRLVVYDDDVIVDACAKYLGSSSSGYEADPVTVTKTVYGPTATVTATPSTCIAGEKYPMYTKAPAYGDDDSSTAEGYATPTESKDSGYETPYVTFAGYGVGYAAPSDIPYSYNNPEAPHETPHEAPKPAVCGIDGVVHTVTEYVTYDDSAPYSTDTPYAESWSAPYYGYDIVTESTAESTPAPYYGETAASAVPYYGDAASSDAPYYGSDSTTESYEDVYVEPTSAPYYGDAAPTDVPYYGDAGPSDAPYYDDDSASDAYNAPYATTTSEEIAYASAIDAPYSDEPTGDDYASPIEDPYATPSATDSPYDEPTSDYGPPPSDDSAADPDFQTGDAGGIPTWDPLSDGTGGTL